MTRRKIKENLRVHFNNTLLTEVFDSMIKTNYKIIDFGEYIAYQFKTNSGNQYDLEFHYSEENIYTDLDNNIKLGDILKTNKETIPCFDIVFTLSKIKNKENPDEFEINTNLNEEFELMGRITFIISEIINDSKYKLFIIGGDSRRNRLKIYENMFKNNFINLFDLYYGKSQFHSGKSLFIIRK